MKIHAGKFACKALLLLAWLALSALSAPSLMMQAHVWLEENEEKMAEAAIAPGKSHSCEHHHDHSGCPVCKLFACLANETASEPSPAVTWQQPIAATPIRQETPLQFFSSHEKSEVLPRAPPF